MSKSKAIRFTWIVTLISLGILFFAATIIYLSNVHIYEDLEIKLQSKNPNPQLELIGYTPLNKSIILPHAHAYDWQVKNSFYKKILLKIENPDSLASGMTIIVNNKSFTFSISELKGNRLIEIPYQSNGSLIEKFFYVTRNIVNGLFFINNYLNLLIIFVFYLIVLFVSMKISKKINFKNKYLDFLSKIRTIRYSIFDILIVVFVTIFLLLTIEFFFYSALKMKGINFSFLINHQKEKEIGFQDKWGFNQIDPLLGWSMSKDDLKAKGYHSNYNMIEIENILPQCKDTLRILITGGSTSDFLGEPQNWVKCLADTLKQQGYSYLIYNAAVAGYNSGQELLKLIRDGLKIKPDIHISYSGANETENPYYSSGYEERILENLISVKQNLFLMPNTVYYLNYYFFSKNTNMVLLKPDSLADFKPFEFWENNVRIMEAIANINDYHYFCILQPVLGSDGSNEINNANKYSTLYKTNYKFFYDKAIVFSKNNNYCSDFTKIFTQYTVPVFKDDCHILKEYEAVVAHNVFTLLKPTMANEHKQIRER